jgi:hypothetical protein
MIEIVQKHPAFSIEPLEGIIPFNQDALINVTYSPKEFCTAILTIQLIISQFNSKPIVCTFYGVSTPGLARDEFYSKYKKLGQQQQSETFENLNENKKLSIESAGDTISAMTIEQIINENKNLSTQNEAKNNDKKKSKSLLYSSINKKSSANSDVYKDVAPRKEMFTEYEGFRFPVNLNNPWAISKVLIQTRGRMSLKDVKSASKVMKLSAQAKEQLFLQKVNDLENEERKNQLKWQIKLGENLIDDETREDILRSRAQAEYEYKLSIGVPFLEQEIQRKKGQVAECRTFRDYNQVT